MRTLNASNDEPEKWPLEKALAEKLGYTGAQIEELRRSMDHLDFVEFVMGFEEEFGIEIVDEDFLEGGGNEPLNGLKS
jgi:acyl carrier protein